jgi:hypothetical protein
MIIEGAELAFYWSLPTGAIINLDLPGAVKAIEAFGSKYPHANQAAIDKIDEVVKQLVRYEKANVERDMK